MSSRPIPKQYARSRGFTLIELLVVIAVIAALAGTTLGLLNTTHQFDKAKDAQRRSDFEQLFNAIELYNNDHNSYPTSIPFGSQWSENTTVYMAKTPQDPDCHGGTQHCTPYLYIADPKNPSQPQWYVAYGELVVPPAQARTPSCNIPCVPSMPKGYNLCISGGNVDCSALSGGLAAITPPSGSGGTASNPTTIPTLTGTSIPTPTLLPTTQTGTPLVTLDNTSYMPSSGIWNHTIGGQQNMILLAGFSLQNASALDTITTVYYGTQQMNKLAGVSNNESRGELWYLKNPTPGTAQIVATSPGGHIYGAGAASYYNVDLTSSLTATTNARIGGTSQNPSVTVSGINSNQLVVDSVASHQTNSISPDTGQTQLWNANVTDITPCIVQWCSGGSSKPGQLGTTTVGWNSIGSWIDWVDIAVPLNPSK